MLVLGVRPRSARLARRVSDVPNSTTSRRVDVIRLVGVVLDTRHRALGEIGQTAAASGMNSLGRQMLPSFSIVDAFKAAVPWFDVPRPASAGGVNGRWQRGPSRAGAGHIAESPPTGRMGGILFCYKMVLDHLFVVFGSTGYIVELPARIARGRTDVSRAATAGGDDLVYIDCVFAAARRREVVWAICNRLPGG